MTPLEYQEVLQNHIEDLERIRTLIDVMIGMFAALTSLATGLALTAVFKSR